MTEKAKQARREYKRRWNQNNPDKVKAAQERYCDKKAEEMQDQEQQEADT